ncbi:MAG: (d)CMP kinase [Acidobacteria bacterium]|nr:(d)CMP kinase [Acidobacteriota bacterium]
MTTSILIVAIDGPSGVCKSTAARMLAARLDVPYLETGAMYRALGLKALDEGVDPDDPSAVEKLLTRLDLDVELTADGEIVVLLDGVGVQPRIRSAEVANATSRISVHAPVRRFMVDLQRRWASRRGAVVEGRDIGTRVFPDTPFKFFFDAAPEVRAARRFEQLRQAGEVASSLSEIQRQVLERDARDSSRAESPLRRDESYVAIDTGLAGPEEVVDQMLRTISARRRTLESG